MEVIIRKAEKPDYPYTENLTREVFWDLYKPGCNEHLVLHQLRKSPAFIPGLDLVALLDGRIVGHIICTKARIINDQGNEFPVLCAGPFAVIHAHQKKGIGSKLMEEAIANAQKLNYPGIILFGDPGYYPRFGYRNAAEFNITTKEGRNFDPFMALELQPGSLENINGKFYEDDTFEVNEKDLEEFEKGFPFKEKHVIPGQLFG